MTEEEGRMGRGPLSAPEEEEGLDRGGISGFDDGGMVVVKGLVDVGVGVGGLYRDAGRALRGGCCGILERLLSVRVWDRRVDVDKLKLKTLLEMPLRVVKRKRAELMFLFLPSFSRFEEMRLIKSESTCLFR